MSGPRIPIVPAPRDRRNRPHPSRRRISLRELCCAVAVVLSIDAVASPLQDLRAQSTSDHAALPVNRPTLTDAQSHFYNARYAAAAATTLALRTSDAEDLAAVELRSAALLFQIRALLEGKPAKDDTLKRCEACPALLEAFFAEIRRGQNLARERLRSDPADAETLFFLGKLDLNYVWLQLGPLRRKTGWDEYWEARHSLDAVLVRNPGHVRARVARAWIDYIVDTKMPWGTRWVLGGGNRKKALADIREAARMDADFFTHAEAEFALWDMQVRERDMIHATEAARRLARDFPDNREVAAFLQAREAADPR